MIWTLGDFNSVYLLTGGGPGGPDERAGHTRHPLPAARPEVDLAMAAIVVALPAVLPLMYFMMKRLSK